MSNEKREARLRAMKQAGEERRQTAEAYQRAMTAVREQVKPLLGDHVAKRVKTFDDRTLFVESTVWGAIMAWLIDSVLVNGTALALAVLYGVRSTDPNRAGGAVVIFVVLLIVLPLLYGWFYANGRGIGALLTGTQLVRLKDGSRVGLAKAGWAMMIRTLFMPVLLLSALSGDMSGPGDVRLSIDRKATAALRSTGIMYVA